MILKKPSQMVRDFHKAFGHPVDNKTLLSDLLFREFRISLIEEELEELKTHHRALEDLELDTTQSEGITTYHKAEILDALCDILYVTYGFAIACGLDIDKAFERVHKSNMSKLGSDGKPVYRQDGKIMKSSNYIPPYLEDLVE